MGIFPCMFQAEVHAYVERNVDRNYNGQDITIMSGKQAAIRALWSPVINLRWFGECLRKLTDIERRNKVTLLRVPGHVGLEGNEETDELARKGAAAPLVSLELFCGLGKHYYNSVSKRYGRIETCKGTTRRIRPP